MNEGVLLCRDDAIEFYVTNRKRIAVLILAATVAALGCLAWIMPGFIVKIGGMLFMKGSCFEIFID